jgi:hypothetical protein
VPLSEFVPLCLQPAQSKLPHSAASALLSPASSYLCFIIESSPPDLRHPSYNPTSVFVVSVIVHIRTVQPGTNSTVHPIFVLPARRRRQCPLRPPAEIARPRLRCRRSARCFLVSSSTLTSSTSSSLELLSSLWPSCFSSSSVTLFSVSILSFTLNVLDFETDRDRVSNFVMTTFSCHHILVSIFSSSIFFSLLIIYFAFTLE